jgi:hypothetical protein
MIAGNKFVMKPDVRELYSARVEAIKWFEKNHPDQFNLYGIGWDKPARKKNGFPKFKYRIEKITNLFFGRKAFPSYKGPIKSKREVLESAKFCICFENIQNIPGYITEKIFDCFFSGCVPIYWGDEKISQHIPSVCYIDRRAFKSMSDLYKFISEMPESIYLNYQFEIKKFIMSDRFDPFCSTNFAKTIVNHVLLNVNRTADA